MEHPIFVMLFYFFNMQDESSQDEVSKRWRVPGSTLLFKHKHLNA